MARKPTPAPARSLLRPILFLAVLAATFLFVFLDKSPMAWWAERNEQIELIAQEELAATAALEECLLASKSVEPKPLPVPEPTPSWSQDLRWQEASRLASLAESDWKKAVAEQDKEGGLVLVAFQREARQRIENAMALLDDLAADCSDLPSAQIAIAEKRRSVERQLRHLRH